MEAPAYITDFYEKQRGRRLVLITKKTFILSDLSGQQSRLLLPRSSLSVLQQNLLSLRQQAAANLLSEEEMKSMIDAGILVQEDMKSAIQLEGVRAQVFIFSAGERRQGQGRLIRWTAGSIVITGRDALGVRRDLRDGDVIQVWGFINEDNELRIVIHNL